MQETRASLSTQTVTCSARCQPSCFAQLRQGRQVARGSLSTAVREGAGRGVPRCPSLACHRRVARGGVPPAGTLTVESWGEWLSWTRALHRLRGETSCLRFHDSWGCVRMCPFFPLGVSAETIRFSLKTAVLGVVESCRPEHVFPVVPQSRLRVGGDGRGIRVAAAPQASCTARLRLRLCSAEKVLPELLHPPPPRQPPRAFRLTR